MKSAVAMATPKITDTQLTYHPVASPTPPLLFHVRELTHTLWLKKAINNMSSYSRILVFTSYLLEGRDIDDVINIFGYLKQINSKLPCTYVCLVIEITDDIKWWQEHQ